MDEIIRCTTLDCERPAYKGGPLCLSCGYDWQVRMSPGGLAPLVDKSAFVDDEPMTVAEYRRQFG